jgi:hypothetical protein
VRTRVCAAADNSWGGIEESLVFVFDESDKVCTWVFVKGAFHNMRDREW